MIVLFLYIKVKNKRFYRHKTLQKQVFFRRTFNDTLCCCNSLVMNIHTNKYRTCKCQKRARNISNRL